VLLCPCVALAAPLTVLNPGFESPVLANGVSSATALNWAEAPSIFALSLNPSAADMNGGLAAEGNNVGASVKLENSPTMLFQSLAATLSANTTYTLTVAIGHPIPNAPPFGPPLTYGGYQVVLSAGNTVLAQDNTSIVVPLGEYRTSTVNYTALPGNPLLGQPLVITLLTPGTTTFDGVYFDDVKLDATPVPEPSAVVSIALGGLLLLRVRRKVGVKSRF